MKNKKTILEGEYKNRGEYHKELDPHWSYYPIYIRKMEFVRDYVKKNIKPSDKILDVGCGEGILAEEFRKKGYDVQGIDLYYASNLVQKGDVCNISFCDEHFNYVLCLDLIEHLSFSDQEKALKEICRVLSKDGKVIMTIPNLAHMRSRIKFLFHGELIRTADIMKHPGDRPIKEYLNLITNTGFKIQKHLGIKLTLPIIFDRFFKKILSKGLYEKFIYEWKHPPELCFLNIIIANKQEKNFL